jgi:hypothetical protein
MSDPPQLQSQPEIATQSNQKPARHWLSPEAWKAANDIADQLNETEKKARRQIMTIVKRMGLLFAQEVLQQALTVDAEGGMMLADGCIIYGLRDPPIYCNS